MYTIECDVRLPGWVLRLRISGRSLSFFERISSPFYSKNDHVDPVHLFQWENLLYERISSMAESPLSFHLNRILGVAWFACKWAQRGLDVFMKTQKALLCADLQGSWTTQAVRRWVHKSSIRRLSNGES